MVSSAIATRRTKLAAPGEPDPAIVTYLPARCNFTCFIADEATLHVLFNVPYRNHVVKLTRMATIIVALVALGSISPASAEENLQDSISERKAMVWRVAYRVAGARSEDRATHPLLAWAMAMKKKVEAERHRRMQGRPYGPMPSVDPATEQMTIDK